MADKENGSKGQGDPGQKGLDVKVDIQADMKSGIVYFRETHVNGLLMIDPKTIAVPAQSIIVVACQMILAGMGVRPGQATTVKSDGTAKPKSNLEM